jgi:hypothetical protein
LNAAPLTLETATSVKLVENLDEIKELLENGFKYVKKTTQLSSENANE